MRRGAHWDSFEPNEIGMIDRALVLKKLDTEPLNNRESVLQGRFLLPRKLPRQMTHQYIAGFQWNQLPAQLCWGIDGLMTRRSQYRAPAGSWMSLDGKISIPMLDRDCVCLIDKVGGYGLRYVTDEGTAKLHREAQNCQGLFPHRLMPHGSGRGEWLFRVMR